MTTKTAAIFVADTGHVLSAFTRVDDTTPISPSEKDNLLKDPMKFSLAKNDNVIFTVAIPRDNLDLLELQVEDNFLTRPQAYCLVKDGTLSNAIPNRVAVLSNVTSSPNNFAVSDHLGIKLTYVTVQSRPVRAFLFPSTGQEFHVAKGELPPSIGSPLVASSITLNFVPRPDPNTSYWLVLLVAGVDPFDNDAIVYKKQITTGTA